jgi:opacity protein-like surface antigen
LETAKKNQIMKRTNCLITGVCAATLAAAGADSQIQPPAGSYSTTTRTYIWPGYTGPMPGQPGDFYFDTDLGGVLQQDLIIRNAGQSVSFDPGISANLNFGYNITDALAVEFQTGVASSEINTSGSQALVFSGYSADIYQVPIMANFIFKVPIPGGLTPYFGVGYGGAVTTLESYRRGYYVSDTDITPAYQAIAGLRVALNRRTEVGVGYRFLATSSHTWFADSQNLYTPTGPTFSHSILATLSMSF